MAVACHSMASPNTFLLHVVLLLICLCTHAKKAAAVTTNTTNNERPKGFLIGTGIYDITGPAAQINFMGYAKPDQTGHGIHQRLRARTFIMAERAISLKSQHEIDEEEHQIEMIQRRDRPMEDETKQANRERSLLRWRWKERENDAMEDSPPSETLLADPTKAVCFVSIDTGMGSDLLNIRVLKKLEEILPVQGSSGKRLCHLENLSISGTHTHSAPAGFLQYTTFQITSAGFSEETMEAFAEGIAQSVKRAYDNLLPGSIMTANGLLKDSNINRSPSSYLLNPKSERDEYSDEGDTDKNMLLLKFTTEDGTDIGTLNWFSVHGTSMNGTNKLISGDNKGYASYLMEKRHNKNGTLPGKGDFVAAFASTNLGDVSPNTDGPKCIDTGLPCDVHSSTCNGKMELCVASGPGKDMLDSTEIIGRNQFDHAVSLFERASAELSGVVDFRHSFIDMSNITVTLKNGTTVKTCPPALGYSFAAGTTDGAGDFNFQQGSNSSNPFWNMASAFLSKPSTEQIRCHWPKPILLNVGKVKLPYAWEPHIVPISIFRVGDLFILSVPGEFTTMAGRRLRRAVRDILIANGIVEPIITIAGLANSYTHYIATFEEYQGQRYEAASTIFGPHTLEAYIQEFKRLTHDFLNGQPSTSEIAPRDLSKNQISIQPPVIVDTVGPFRKFGSMAIDAKESYTRGDNVFVSFRSANPRNNQRIEGTFLTVEKQDESGKWQTLYVDGDWCTKFYWKGGVGHFGESFAEITW
eukprot:CAMPEP_0195296218 /NCGR_PEP_ID=MMETSP0707-20130614/18994_1 /TAXON_ID=33640 /ORGANISM="Asterionellopsis glacialis, Strain CCMP134" /LENGTH=751 /DNA_ID=CAMNT_0040357659 /DNA_START=41 /DNA_END=2293 /DNA_ORIENTATION=-